MLALALALALAQHSPQQACKPPRACKPATGDWHWAALLVPLQCEARRGPRMGARRWPRVFFVATATCVLAATAAGLALAGFAAMAAGLFAAIAAGEIAATATGRAAVTAAVSATFAAGRQNFCLRRRPPGATAARPSRFSSCVLVLACERRRERLPAGRPCRQASCGRGTGSGARQFGAVWPSFWQRQQRRLPAAGRRVAPSP